MSWITLAAVSPDLLPNGIYHTPPASAKYFELRCPFSAESYVDPGAKIEFRTYRQVVSGALTVDYPLTSHTANGEVDRDGQPGTGRTMMTGWLSNHRFKVLLSKSNISTTAPCSAGVEIRFFNAAQQELTITGEVDPNPGE
jgi:hypothetical protein